jgi:hypothetical protein
MRKRYSLIDKVWSRQNLLEAFDKVKRNKGGNTSGIGGTSVKEFRKHLADNLSQIHEELRSGTYEPQAVKRVYTSSSGGWGTKAVLIKYRSQGGETLTAPFSTWHYQRRGSMKITCSTWEG